MMNMTVWNMRIWFIPFATFLSLLVLATGVGSSWISPNRIIMALAGYGSDTDTLIVWTLRLPRLILAALGGACLATAGFLLQRALRNPLASPGVLGIVDGAGVGVLVFLWLLSDAANALTVSILYQPVAASLGAVLAALLVAFFAWRDFGQPVRLILYGIAVAAIAKSIVTAFVLLAPVFSASKALIWFAGSVHAAKWSDAMIVGTLFVVLWPIAMLMSRQLDQSVLDDETAVGTGLSVLALRGCMIALAVALTATAVSFIGAVGFVGLVAPHAAQALVGLRSKWVLIVTPLLGASMVLAADIIARTAASPLELPTGSITALVGAPYFIYLLIRQARHDQ